MRYHSVRKLIVAALIAALCCISTMAITIPTPTGGYVHAGDTFVILAGVILGPIYGGLAAGIGSMLSDLFLGYTLYAPATFLIKFIAAIIVGFITRLLQKHTNKIASTVLAGLCSTLIITLGYFLFELLLTDNIYSAVISGIFGNLMQGFVSLILSTLFIKLIPHQILQKVNELPQP